jgi:asparagine synthase (glutamine-hydrolysing)
MCGIAGIVSGADAFWRESRAAVLRMSERMRKRGPDGEGLWAAQGVILAHRRLAILDLDPRSNQPMVTPDGRYAIVFNGEIYNFRVLRAELENAGFQFRTTSDTEILLTMFAREGERMLPKLRGMFALAIWDTQARELFLARDPYGIKPLYYSQTRSGIIFASQVKAVIASGLVSPEIEAAGLTGFYLWGSVPEPWTIFKNVFALPAGCWLRMRAGTESHPVCWNDIRENWRLKNSTHPAKAAQEHVKRAVIESVRAHLVSDVPVSIFLSGGVDSSVIAGLASELGAKVEGITIGFEEFSARHQDEVPVAAEIARHYGLPHHVRRISRTEFDEDSPRILDAMDQPSIDGVNTWFASKAAAERGYKVVLSGIGGDELFRGYSYIRQIPRNVRLSKLVDSLPGSRFALGTACNYLAQKRSYPKLKGVPQFLGSVEGAYFLKRGLFLPQELPELLDPEMTRIGLERLGEVTSTLSGARGIDGISAVCLLDSTVYLRNQLLRDSDWASMAHSLELRTPLVDAALLDTLQPYFASFSNRAGKAMLANSPSRALPSEVLHRRKTGFGVPMARWLGTTQTNGWNEIPLLAGKETPWARRWAKMVMDHAVNDALRAFAPEIRAHAHAG